MADRVTSRKGTARATLYLETRALAVLDAGLESKDVNRILRTYAGQIQQGAVAAERMLDATDWEYLCLCAERLPKCLAYEGPTPELELWAMAEEGYNEGRLHEKVWNVNPDERARILLRRLTGVCALSALAILTALRHFQGCAGCRALVGDWWTVDSRVRCAERAERAKERAAKRKSSAK